MPAGGDGGGHGGRALHGHQWPPLHLLPQLLTIFLPLCAMQSATAAGALKLGACGYDAGGPAASGTDAWPEPGATAALGPGSPLLRNLTMSACGACLEVECEPSSPCAGGVGSVIVTVVDACAGCPSEVGVALHPAAARSLAPEASGSFPARYRQARRRHCHCCS